MQDDTSQGTLPRVSITPSSRLTSPPSTATGSQVSGTQTTGECASVSQDETEGHEGTAP
jgi:hypothetical protein